MAGTPSQTIIVETYFYLLTPGGQPNFEIDGKWAKSRAILKFLWLTGGFSMISGLQDYILQRVRGWAMNSGSLGLEITRSFENDLSID